MKPWELLGKVRVPGGTEVMTLQRRDTEYRLNVDGHLLMSSLTRASEEDLARIGCRGLSGAKRPSVLIGGLGMGFTLAAALKALGPGARVFVSELLPEVVEWNRGPLADLAGRPLEDPRVTVLQEDIAAIWRRERSAYDAILQDVDNGHEGLTLKANDWLYAEDGLAAAGRALKPGGVLAFWLAKSHAEFAKRVSRAGFQVSEVPVRGRDGHRGAHHVILVASPRPADSKRRP